MNKIELAPGVYFVGAVDWNQRDFHGYNTPRGVTYNSYLIVDEKICLIDTVKAPFAAELLERISDIIDPAKIDYVVTNHVEPDHSSALPAIMARAPQAKVVLTEQGRSGILKHYQQNFDFQIVQEGDVLDLGHRRLRFFPLPMLHWPDSMASYLEEDQILFSNDAFGQHICTTKPFDDENNLADVMYEASKYYANILMPFGKIVTKALAQLKPLPIKIIAPSHGVVWRSHISDIVSKYADWGQGKTVKKVVIVYDTMWGSTERMARYILDGLAAAGVTGTLFKMSASTRSEIMAEVLEARGVLIGSSTINTSVLPTIGGLLIYMKGLKLSGKIGAAFGAYGWGGTAHTFTEEMLKGAGVELAASALRVQWTPNQDEIDKCFQFGLDFGKRVLETP